MNAQRLSLARILKVLVITGLTSVLCIQLLAPALMAVAVTMPLRSRMGNETPEKFGAAYSDVAFNTEDGLKLSGWYLPPRNGVVIILVHSYYGDRRQTLPVAEMLYKHGFGLLMYDQRASGESAGGTRSLGALDIADVGRAADWLTAQQADVRIGAYGCSMGGAIALAGAIQTPAIRAVSVDAPSPLNWLENLPAFSLRDPLSLPTMALYYSFVMLRSGTIPPASTLENVRSYAARPILFISSGQAAEYAGVNVFFEAAAGPKAHWNNPDSSHCAGPLTHPLEYEQQLVNFYSSYLAK